METFFKREMPAMMVAMLAGAASPWRSSMATDSISAGSRPNGRGQAAGLVTVDKGAAGAHQQTVYIGDVHFREVVPSLGRADALLDRHPDNCRVPLQMC